MFFVEVAYVNCIKRIYDDDDDDGDITECRGLLISLYLESLPDNRNTQSACKEPNAAICSRPALCECNINNSERRTSART